MKDLTGKEFGRGRYKVVERLGSGGMGVVYKANQLSLNRVVAIKVMPKRFAHDSTFVKRFRQEAEAASKLQHPNIVRVFDYGVEDDYHYIVMELIKSETTLADQLKGQPVPLKQISRLLEQIGDALDYAHSLGVIHRDVKPSNILVKKWRGVYLLTDFGIIKLRRGPHNLTRRGSSIGTPAYMSPEQIRGKKIDGRSDLYSLGVVLFQMTTGRLPFLGETEPHLYSQHLLDAPPSLCELNPDLPNVYDRVILKLLSKDPDDRFSTARAIQKAMFDTGQFPVISSYATKLMEDSKPIKPTKKTEGESIKSEQPEAEKSSSSSHQPQPEEALSPTLSSHSPSSQEKALLDTSEMEDEKTAIAPVEESQLPREDEAAPTTPTKAVVDTALGEVTPGEKSIGQQVVRKMEPLLGHSRGADPATPEISSETSQPDEELVSGPRKWLWMGLAGVSIIMVGIAAVIGIGGFGESPTPTNTQLPVAMVSPTLISTVETPQLSTIPPTESVTTTEPTSEPSETSNTEPILVETVEVQTNTDEIDEIQSAETEDSIIPEEPDEVQTDDIGEDNLAQPENIPSRELGGKLAIPLQLGSEPKVYVVNTNGDVLESVGTARQPDYTLDGTKLIVNGEGGPYDKLRLITASQDGFVEIGDPGLAGHSHPFWSPDGTRVIYDDITVDPAGWRIFIRSLDDDQGTGTILSAVSGPIIAQNPIWASEDRFIFRGCNTWANNPGDCGLWLMQGNPGTPIKLTDNSNHIPTDVYGNMLVYVSAGDGNWNVYTLNLNDRTARQLTTDPAADGLATISPDGRSVAFVSDRDGSLAVWQIDISGSSPSEKLFDVPTQWGFLPAEWWAEERMSWAN